MTELPSHNEKRIDRQSPEISVAAGFRMQNVFEVLSRGLGLSALLLIDGRSVIFQADTPPAGHSVPDLQTLMIDHLDSGALKDDGALLRIDAPIGVGYAKRYRGITVVILIDSLYTDTAPMVFRVISTNLEELVNEPLVVEKAKSSGVGVFALSPYWIKRYDLLVRMSRSVAPLLLSGPSGTGKDFLAMQLHAMSGAKDPFVHVHLSSIPQELFEVELFGATRGAFTGADVDRLGRFAFAKKGTIYLDDITEIPLQTQAKLLRVLEDGTYTPLGSNVPQKIEARIVSSTKQNVHELVAKGTFREDLMYRLNVLPIRLPALNERPEDIVFFVSRFESERHDMTFKRVTMPELRLLERRNWPGNIRELFAFLERRASGLSDESVYASPAGASKELDLKSAVFVFKRELIRDILLRCSGNITEAARILDIQRTYLSRLIRELSIYPEQEK